MLQIAANWLEQEANEIAEAKEAYMAEKCPAPELSGDQTALMVNAEQRHMSTHGFLVFIRVAAFCVFNPDRSFAKSCIWLWIR